MTGKYGRRNVSKMIRQMEELRAAIRAEGTPSIQTAWDAVEEHIDYAYQNHHSPLTPPPLVKSQELLAKVGLKCFQGLLLCFLQLAHQNHT